MTNLRCALAATALSSLALVASAQTMKPGLWEISHQTRSASGDLGAKMAAAQEQMAKLPPDQRKMMEDMMAKQGVTMGAGGPAGGMTMKV